MERSIAREITEALMGIRYRARVRSGNPRVDRIYSCIASEELADTWPVLPAVTGDDELLDSVEAGVGIGASDIKEGASLDDNAPLIAVSVAVGAAADSVSKAEVLFFETKVWELSISVSWSVGSW